VGSNCPVWSDHLRGRGRFTSSNAPTRRNGAQ
jgi:hypothetical protein